MDLAPGTLLGGRYRVGPLLGSGGMGSVYEGVQEGLNRKVALKVLHPHLSGERELIERFKREAHSIAALAHPNVVQVNDFQTNDGEPPFIVMELLEGESLSALLKRQPQLPPERVAYIAVQVLSALGAAHKKDIVHRDIKPDNIYLCSTSVQADLVKVLDFGVAKVLRDNKDPKITRQGFVVGTLSYMSPEQAKGEDLDGRADLYSLGAVLYVALAGRKPFDAPTTPAVVAQILRDKPVPLAAIRTDVDVKLLALVERALEKDRTARFASAEEMATAFAPFASPTTALVADTRPTDRQPRAVSSLPTVPQIARPDAPATSPDTVRLQPNEAPHDDEPMSQAPIGQRSPRTPVPPAPLPVVPPETTLRSNPTQEEPKRTLPSNLGLGVAARAALADRPPPVASARTAEQPPPALPSSTSPIVWIALVLVPVGIASLLGLGWAMRSAFLTDEPVAAPSTAASTVSTKIADASAPIAPSVEPAATSRLGTTKPPTHAYGSALHPSQTEHIDASVAHNAALPGAPLIVDPFASPNRQ